MKSLKRHLRPLASSLLMLACMSLLTGLAYPLLVTGLARVAFPVQAAGSLVAGQDGIAGSRLVGQQFNSPRHFWGRPSSTASGPYDASASSGSNLGPSNPALLQAVAERVEALRAAHGDAPVPMELVTASASGLDPHISPSAAYYQAARVARAQGLSEDVVRGLVARNVEGRLWGLWGAPRVNVLELNLALDALSGKE